MGLEDLAKIKDKLKSNTKKVETKKSKDKSFKAKDKEAEKSVSKIDKRVENKGRFDNFPKSGNLKIKIKTLSPIHIGSGEVYEPTNFIIDENTLYHFRDEDFLEALSDIQRVAFLNIVNESSRSDSFVRINKFVKDNKEIAKKVAFLKVKTTHSVQREYFKKVGKISQIEADNIKVFNKFEIQRIQRKQLKDKNGNYWQLGYLVGSSLKGAISTAYQEFISKKEGKQSRLNKFENSKITKNIFKNLKISDSKILKSTTKIGFACNKERFEDDESGLSTLIEVINLDSEFEVSVNYKDLSIKDIFESCNIHYFSMFKNLLNGIDEKNQNDLIFEYFPDEFCLKYKDFDLKDNQFILRVGKHSGARAVTIDGDVDDKRKIKVKVNKHNNETRSEETTTWLFGEDGNSTTNLLPFGWLLCEVVK